MTASYLYCVVRSTKKPTVARAPAGLPGATRPEAVKVTPALWLVVADVPLDLYGGSALEASLADLEWVGRIAVAHEEVVEHFAGRPDLTVVPMKLFTMFSSPERAVADVGARRAAIGQVMRRIAGAEEWGVRISRAGSAPPEAQTPAPAPSGAAFLAARKQARDATRNARMAAAEAALDAFDILAKLARESRRRDVAAPAGATPPLLDAAFLVPRAQRAGFDRAARQAARACAGAGAQMTLSGPWPAYNFVASGEQAP